MKMKTIISVLLVLSLIGLADSIYSTYEHYQILAGAAGESFCDLSGEVSCSAVNGSPYAEILGIPLALLGVAWFIVTLFLIYQIKGSKSGFWKNSPFYFFVWSIIGLLSVFWFVYAELYLIGAICLLCTLVHIIVIVTLFLSYKLLKKPIGKYMEDIFYK